MKRDGLVILVAIAAALGMLVGAFLVGYHVRDAQLQPPVADTVTIVTRDTTFLPSPPDTVTNTREIPVPVPSYIKDTDTIHDTITVILPFEQHHARLGEVADVWYSGYRAQIDSALLYETHTTQIIREPYIKEHSPQLTFDLGVGGLYNEKRVNPYMFGEMRIAAPKTTWTVYGGITHEGRWGAGAAVSYRITIMQ